MKRGRGMIKVHVDTDLGGDIDDLCALAMLLRREDVEITGITTVAENGGKRARRQPLSAPRQPVQRIVVPPEGGK